MCCDRICTHQQGTDSSWFPSGSWGHAPHSPSQCRSCPCYCPPQSPTTHTRTQTYLSRTLSADAVNVLPRHEWQTALNQHTQTTSYSFNRQSSPKGSESVSFGKLSFTEVPMGSPSRGGDVTVHVKDINQLSLPTPSSDNSLFSHSVLPVLSLPYWSF